MKKIFDDVMAVTTLHGIQLHAMEHLRGNLAVKDFAARQAEISRRHHGRESHGKFHRKATPRQSTT